MVPKFIMVPNAKICSHAMAYLSYFVPINVNALYDHIDMFITCLFK
jgi:transportin-1